MTDMSVLVLPDFTKEFIIETNASGEAIGAILSQNGHPIAFFSKKMCPRMQAASVYVREMFAITESEKKWNQYLIGQKFIIYTDQKSLRNLLLQKIQGFNFDIFYKPGSSNLVADALSRKFASDELVLDVTTLLALTSSVPNLLSTLRAFYQNDSVGQLLLKLIEQTDPNNILDHLTNELLYYKNKIFIHDLPQLRHSLILEYHSTPTAGHSGVKATLARLGLSFYWLGVYLQVKNLVKHCNICQHNKYETHKKKGFLQPLPILEYHSTPTYQILSDTQLFRSFVIA